MFLDSESKAFRKSATKSALVSLQFPTCLTPVIWLPGIAPEHILHKAGRGRGAQQKPRQCIAGHLPHCWESEGEKKKNTLRLSSDKPTLWFQRLAKKQDYFCLKQCSKSFWISGGWMDRKYAVWTTETGPYLVAGRVSVRFCCHERWPRFWQYTQGETSPTIFIKMLVCSCYLAWQLATSVVSLTKIWFDHIYYYKTLLFFFCSNRSTTLAVMKPTGLHCKAPHVLISNNGTNGRVDGLGVSGFFSSCSIFLLCPKYLKQQSSTLFSLLHRHLHIMHTFVYWCLPVPKVVTKGGLLSLAIQLIELSELFGRNSQNTKLHVLDQKSAKWRRQKK